MGGWRYLRLDKSYSCGLLLINEIQTHLLKTSPIIERRCYDQIPNGAIVDTYKFQAYAWNQ